jgi:hypothetical protein
MNMSEEKHNTENNHVSVYVDGSYNKSNNLTGAGIVIIHGDRIYKKAFLVETEENHS